MTTIFRLTNAAPTPANYTKVDMDPSVSVRGTFDSGTVTLHQDIDNTAIQLPNAASPLEITAAGVYPINLGAGARIQPRLSGDSGSADLVVEINGTKD